MGGGNNVNDFPENQLTKNTVWTIKTFSGGGTITFGGRTAISGGGTPNTDGGMAFRPILAELNHWIWDRQGRSDYLTSALTF